jgi:hypothetical protein
MHQPGQPQKAAKYLILTAKQTLSVHGSHAFCPAQCYLCVSHLSKQIIQPIAKCASRPGLARGCIWSGRRRTRSRARSRAQSPYAGLTLRFCPTRQIRTLLGVVDFTWTPALAVALDHSDPKASPPLAVVVGLPVGFPRDAIDVDDEEVGCFCDGRPL